MTTSDHDAARLLWEASDQMRQATEEMRVARVTMQAVAGEMGWRASAAVAFQNRLTTAIERAGEAMMRCSDEADVLLANGNRAMLP